MELADGDEVTVRAEINMPGMKAGTTVRVTVGQRLRKLIGAGRYTVLEHHPAAREPEPAAAEAEPVAIVRPRRRTADGDD